MEATSSCSQFNLGLGDWEGGFPLWAFLQKRGKLQKTTVKNFTPHANEAGLGYKNAYSSGVFKQAREIVKWGNTLALYVANWDS